MRLPPDIVINNISDWKVLYFKDLAKGASCPPHFHVVIPTLQNQYLVLCLISTKIDQRKKFYSPAGEEKYLVQVSHDTLSCLTKESIVDCPAAELLDRDTLLNRIEELNNLKTVGCEVSSSLRARIKKAIMSSAVVETRIKKLIK